MIPAFITPLKTSKSAEHSWLESEKDRHFLSKTWSLLFWGDIPSFFVGFIGGGWWCAWGTSCPRRSRLLSWPLPETHRKSDLGYLGEFTSAVFHGRVGPRVLGSEDTK